MDPETLLPKLPDPKELQPFPSRLSIVYKGHKGRIRTFDIDPTGQWMASGGQDNQLKIWEIISGRCLESVQFDSEIFSVSWNPKQSINLVAIAW
jgi:ribosome biogenesis protein ERB1